MNVSTTSHLHSKVNNILNMETLEQGDLPIDVGSIDATALLTYPKSQYRLIDVDPTEFTSYYPPEITIISDSFSAQAFAKLAPHKKAKVITSYSIFYDLEDQIAFAPEIEYLLEDDGFWIFEQSYLPAMLRTNSLDTICHEHFEFYALKLINWIADKAGIKVLDVEFNEVNGGSFSIVAAKRDSTRPVNTEWLNKISEDEAALGLDSTKAFDEFKIQVEEARAALVSFLAQAKRSGKTVCGLGASTKGNVLLQYFGIDENLVTEIGEVNEDKFGSFIPEAYIPLVAEQQVLTSDSDYLLVLPWYFRNFFESLPSMKGRSLVFPLSKFVIVHI